MMYNGKNYLMFERRGCEFWNDDKAREESNIGNYRITTPGEIVPGKDGRMYCLEFGCYDKYDYRKTNKRTGKQLKHSILELTMTTATRLDSQFTDECGSWRNLEMETEFYKTPRKYTEQNIVDYVNSISTVHYDGIMYVDTIQFEEAKTDNFTPSHKIIDWARKNNLNYENTMSGVIVHTYTGAYKYHSYKIEQAHKPENEVVTIYLERVNG